MAMFCGNDFQLRGLILSMSLLDRSDASFAVMYAFASLSALSMSGPENATQFKNRAFSALWRSSQHELSNLEKLQHVAAHLSLARYEVHNEAPMLKQS